VTAATLPPRPRPEPPAPQVQVRFDAPGRDATAPPEARGLRRDDVSLVVARPGRIERTRFRDLAAHLDPGDLVVVNRSATLPAAVDAHRADGRPVVVHASGPHPDDDRTWIVELRRPDGRGPVADVRAGELVQLPGGVGLSLLAAHPDPMATSSRLWRAALLAEVPVERYLEVHGRPITYGYLDGRWPLETYQPVFAREPGSAEMASAGRPFSTEVVTDLVAAGIVVAPVLLHTGVASLEAHEPPQPERYQVPAATAAQVELARRRGSRVVAVGTTVTRALETVTARDGSVRAGQGWTELVLGADRPARVVTGLVTGWHEPGASHLALLEAVAGPLLVQAAYDAAVQGEERWHEFGDSCLLLP
jgi:S-adenosylmethionine:tRNA ribosyltransferase-isomerase